MRIRNFAIPFACFLCFIIACNHSEPKDLGDLSLTLARRSVLDQKARMLTLRFGEERYAAYDLENAQLSKIWRGGVLWNGAAYNNLKTVQPETYGNAYFENADSLTEWSIEHNGHRMAAQLSYEGYRLSANTIDIQYKLTADNGDKIYINEFPYFNKSTDGVSFLRKYKIIENEGGRTIYLGNQKLFDQELATQNVIIEKFYAEVNPAPPPQTKISTTGSQYWLERSGCNTCHEMKENTVGPSYEAISANYPSDQNSIDQLVQNVITGSSGQWGTAAMIPHPSLLKKDVEMMVEYILSLGPEEEHLAKHQNVRPKKSSATEELKQPGFGTALEGVHPSFDLVKVRPSWFKPRVGGMSFLPNGNLLLSTWDSIGAVYTIQGLETNDTNQISITRIAEGLSEPLGLTTVGNDIFVLQKHELTQLIDEDQDGTVDLYKAINHSFGVTPDFHEFSYGLAYQDGYFYGALGLAMRLMSNELQHPDRGTVFKIGMDGSFEIIANGLRQTNGIGVGMDNEIFVTENQGQWSPACKIIHVKPGHFYGCQYGTGDRFKDAASTLPAVWMPQDEIGNSPSQPLLIPDGPYQGQMFIGEVTHGGIKRVFLEKVKGEYQGCVFRFSQGLEAGINRMAWGPDEALYVGGVGMVGGWSHKEKQYGLQKMVFNNKLPFELLAIRASSDGFELEFTHPVDAESSDFSQPISIQQWYYEATPSYGGPKLGLQNLKVTSFDFSDDRKKMNLKITGLKKGYVINFRLSPSIRSIKGEKLWSGDAWYTLNHIPN